MKYSYFLTILISLIIGCKSGQNEEQIKPITRDITEFVYASAKIVPQNTYASRPLRTGTIEEVYIKEGDIVKKGQSLFKISITSDINNRLSNANVNLNEAKDNLYSSQSKLKNIEIELQRIKEQNLIDSSNYDRRKRLWDKNIGSKIEVERALLAYQTSSSRIDGLLVEYQQIKTSLQNQYQRAKNSVNTESSVQGDFIIKSQIEGKVFTILKEVGEFISPQQVFAEIGSNNLFIIEMNIDEVDITKIGIGDTAIINLEAYPDTVYTSTLNYISEKKDESTQTFSVEGVFTNPPAKLFNGLSGEANILVERRKNAIIIPSAYLFDRNKVLTEDGTKSVKTGVKNIEYVEIIEGLDTSMALLKSEIK
jgi:multidrug efflux pump subunit AcrA (membrane-fusion protein)